MCAVLVAAYVPDVHVCTIRVAVCAVRVYHTCCCMCRTCVPYVLLCGPRFVLFCVPYVLLCVHRMCFFVYRMCVLYVFALYVAHGSLRRDEGGIVVGYGFSHAHLSTPIRWPSQE